MAAAPRRTSAAPAVPLTRPVIKDAKVVKQVAEYALAKADIAALEAKCDVLKPAILTALGDAKSVIAGNHVVTRGENAGTEPTPNVTITKEMVGQVIPGRKGKRGYTTLTVQ